MLSAELAPVDFALRTRLVFGAGEAGRLGEFARALGGRRVLLVSDPGVVAAGHAARARQALEAAGLAVALFDGVRENPTTLDVDRCVAAARACEADLLVGLGGGSAMDTAKGCNFLLTNGGLMRDYWGIGKAAKPMLPLIAVPTTAGTGSEMQSAALIADEQSHQKMACLDPKAAARVALLDPVLTLSQPPRVTACTGLDALAHAVESAVTRKRNAVSGLFAREAFRLLAPAFPRVLVQPDDLAARGAMLLGAAWAGLAIENSMLGAAHAAANPLTARFDLTHGEAVGLMLPHVVRFNAEEPAAAAAYGALLHAIGLRVETAAAGAALAGLLADWLRAAGLKSSLRAAGVPPEAVPALATEAARQWTAGFNPRPASAVEFAGLYQAAFAAGACGGMPA